MTLIFALHRCHACGWVGRSIMPLHGKWFAVQCWACRAMTADPCLDVAMPAVDPAGAYAADYVMDYPSTIVPMRWDQPVQALGHA